MATKHRMVGTWLVAGGVAVTLGALTGSFAATSATAEPGNKGTVKIGSAEVDSTDDVDSANHPHVGNPFTVSWFGYDAGSHTTTVSFEAQPPSGTEAMAILDGRASFSFTASGEGGDLNHTETYRLDTTGLEEHPQQGYHVKVTVTVPGAQGNDTKHKTFWITPAQPTESPSPSPTVSPIETPTVSPSPSESPSVSPSVLPTKIVSPSISPSVKGVKRTRTLPKTGPADTAVAVAVGAVLILVGGALVALSPAGTHRR